MQKILLRNHVVEKFLLDSATTKNTIISRFFNFQSSQATLPISNTPTFNPSQHKTSDIEMISDKL